MAEADGATAPAVADVAADDATDERLAHRGPIQQLLTRPEIGALLGAAGVWLLFWLVSTPFGTVGGTANFLDVAAYLGLMAVPVALLMIGGEFDLSSGAMTGATAIVVILLASDIAGAGLGLHIAVPLSLAFALAIGWFNGTLVEKTSLPSFIVTLGTFFILIGAKLGLAKLFTNKVLVEGLDEASGYEFWNGIFGASWLRNGHIWDGRDWAWAGLLVFGGTALLLGTLELSYARRTASNPAGIITSLAGTVAALAGFALLLTQDGANMAYGLLTGAGVIVGVAGWCLARYERPQQSDRGVSAGFVRYFAGGILAVVAAMVISGLMDAGDSGSLGYLGGSPGRIIFAVGIALIGVLAVLAALGRVTPGYPAFGALLMLVPRSASGDCSGGSHDPVRRPRDAGGLPAHFCGRPDAAIGSRLARHLAAIVVLAFFVQSESMSRKLRVELFGVLLVLALVLAAAAVARYLSAKRTSAPAPPQLGLWVRAGGLAGASAAVVFAIAELIDGDDVLYALIAGAAVGGLVAFGVYAVGTVYRTLFTSDEGVGRALGDDRYRCGAAGRGRPAAIHHRSGA